MAVYVFRCTKCGQRLELSASISGSDQLDPLCFEPGCDGQRTEQIIAPTGFILKGSGWAKDGYK